MKNLIITGLFATLLVGCTTTSTQDTSRSTKNEIPPTDTPAQEVTNDTPTPQITQEVLGTTVTYTPTPTSAPRPIYTPTVTKTPTPITTPKATGGFACDCSKTCPKMSSCAEAQFQLNTCGCKARDADHDGIACDSDCQ